MAQNRSRIDSKVLTQMTSYSNSTLLFDELFDIPVSSDETQHKHEINALCTLCATIASDQLASYLCHDCDVYLCEKCFRIHRQSHEIVYEKSETSTRAIKAGNLLEQLRYERHREELLNQRNVHIYSRLKVKYEFDQIDCDLNAFCGLDDKRWTVLDYNNSCIKILDSVTNSLLRYIKFGSKPWDIIKLKTTLSYEHKSAATPELNEGFEQESGKCQLLALTFPSVKQIWLLNVDKCPAEKRKTIQLNDKCFHIAFSDDKLYTLCKKEDEPEYSSVHILSVEGRLLQKIPYNVPGYISDIAVSHGRIFLTNTNYSKVFCICENGEKIREINIDGSEPLGISLGDDGQVYVCASGHDRIYKLDFDLNSYETLDIEQKSTQQPYKLGFHRDKLFLSHLESFSHNFVTVIQLS